MNKLYVTIVALAFTAVAFVFATFPRSAFSELEKRELAVFPDFSWEKLKAGTFTQEVSSWFNDTEPFRDAFMWLSMTVKSKERLVLSDEDNVTFHASDTESEPQPEEAPKADRVEDAKEFENANMANENAKIAHAGIIIVGAGSNVRALMAYGGGAEGGTTYADVANRYQQELGSGVQVYCMVIPTAVEFYCPDKVKKHTKRELPTIKNIFAHLDSGVKPVSIYQALADHVDEDIYLRTDHHWAPLGAYYAAQQFALVAGVPFRDLSSYEKHVVHGYVGSMYGFSGDISVKNAPEDFVYYTPTDVEYTTTYTIYTIDKKYKVTGEKKPYDGQYFMKYKDGSGAAYSTFMGGDTKITRVRTSTANGRRVLVLKDSFGNALPGYMFYSFEEVHVIDFRYFTKNMKAYVSENKITDILFANNIFMAYSPNTAKNYLRFLTQ